MHPGEIHWLRAKAILLTTWKWPLLRYGNAPSSALVHHSNSPGVAGDAFNAHTGVPWCLVLQSVSADAEDRSALVYWDLDCSSGWRHMLYTGKQASAAPAKEVWLGAPCNDGLVVLWFLKKKQGQMRFQGSRWKFLMCMFSHLLTFASFISIICSQKISRHY